MTNELIQSFHSYLNLQSNQMVSYIKNLDMCEELTTFTFFGDFEKCKNIHNYVKNKYLNLHAKISSSKIFGITFVYSEILVPKPPANKITFILISN